MAIPLLKAPICQQVGIRWTRVCSHQGRKKRTRMDTLSMGDTPRLYLALWLPVFNRLIDPQAWVMCSNIEPATTFTLQVRMVRQCWAQVLRSLKTLVEEVSVLIPSSLMLSSPIHSLSVTLSHRLGGKRISFMSSPRARRHCSHI